jgi:hypothetical protein
VWHLAQSQKEKDDDAKQDEADCHGYQKKGPATALDHLTLSLLVHGRAQGYADGSADSDTEGEIVKGGPKRNAKACPDGNPGSDHPAWLSALVIRI